MGLVHEHCLRRESSASAKAWCTWCQRRRHFQRSRPEGYLGRVIKASAQAGVWAPVPGRAGVGTGGRHHRGHRRSDHRSRSGRLVSERCVTHGHRPRCSSGPVSPESASSRPSSQSWVLSSRHSARCFWVCNIRAQIPTAHATAHGDGRRGTPARDAPGCAPGWSTPQQLTVETDGADGASWDTDISPLTDSLQREGMQRLTAADLPWHIQIASVPGEARGSPSCGGSR